MKKFNSKFFGGGRILFLLISALFLSNKMDAQTNVAISGNNKFRNNAYGVGNHNYNVETKITSGSSYIPSTPSPMTTTMGANPCGVYNGTIQLNSDLNLNTNSMKVRPTSTNNYADRINGVSVTDLVAFTKHLNGTVPFNNPYQFVSGDANNSNSVTSTDKDMCQNLILYSTPTTRNSWEWFHEAYVLSLPITFSNNPYQFVLSATWPGPGGFGEIIFTNFSRSQFNGNSTYYTTYTTTHTCDINSATRNSWVCGSIAYLSDNDSESRNNEGIDVKEGETMLVSIELSNAYKDYAGYQMPLFIDNTTYEIEDVGFGNNMNPKWHYNKEHNTLMVLEINDEQDGYAPIKIENGTVLSLILKAKKDVVVSTETFIHLDRNFEMVDIKGEQDEEVEFNIIIKDVLKEVESLGLKSIQNHLIISSATSKDLDINIYNLSGQLIKQDKIIAHIGVTEYDLSDLSTGMYIAKVKIGDDNIQAIKFIR